MTDITDHNQAFWDNEALLQRPWSQPVTKESVAQAKLGQWQLHLTKKPLPATWLPKDIAKKKILCLASAGGQQAPVLAAAGAEVPSLIFQRNSLSLISMWPNKMV